MLSNPTVTNKLLSSARPVPHSALQASTSDQANPAPSMDHLDALEAHLLAFGRRYEQIAAPFEWNFTRADLDRLLARADTRATNLAA